MSVCLVTGDINFDCLVEVMSTRFLHYEDTNLNSFVTNKYHVGKYFNIIYKSTSLC